MLLTIAPNSGIVSIDGIGYKVDLSSFDKTIQGLQWDGTNGHIARWNPDTREMLGDESFKDFSPYSYVIDLFNAEKQKADQAVIDAQKAQFPEMIASKRLMLLVDCDWTQLPDSPLTIQQKQAWAVYRQALRDFPAQPGYPNIDFPVAPV